MSDRTNKSEMGTLLVEVKTVDKTWFAVFWKAGDQGDKWYQGYVDLSVSIWGKDMGKEREGRIGKNV